MDTLVEEKIRNLLKKVQSKQYQPAEFQLIEKATKFATEKHQGQIRKSGEPYIIHPIAVAEFLIDWKMDVNTVVAGLLHDLIEDTPVTAEEIKEEFNEEVAKLVDYVSKVSSFSKQKEKINLVEKDYIVKLFLSMATDLRAMIIKLADRYHNMLTIQYLSPERQIRMAKETFDLYAKVAGRLGMYDIKTKLLDLSFQILKPKEYATIKEQIDQQVSQNGEKWNEVINQIKRILDSYEIEYALSTRIKGVYSTYEKLKKNFTILDIHDLFAIRIVVDQALECYEVLGLIHLNFCYIKRTLKDYISNPKLNLYQSIHTTLNKDNALIEIQIRTKQMDEAANYGIASHWYYKERQENKQKIEKTVNNVIKDEFLNLNRLAAVHQMTRDDLFDVLILNKNYWMIVNRHSTVLDVAYRFDRDNFNSLLTIKKNGKEVLFDTLLEPGDTLKFKYAENKQITLDKSWIRYATIPQIKEAIQKQLSQQFESKKNNLTIFFQDIANTLKDNCLPLNRILKIIESYFQIYNLDDFFEFIAFSKRDNFFFADLFHRTKAVRKAALNRILPLFSNWILQKSFFKDTPGLIVIKLQMPGCCQKIPGITVVGGVNKNTLLIHDYRCPEIKEHSKIVKLDWDLDLITKKQQRFPFNLQFKAYWTPSIGNNIVQNLATFNLLLNKISIEQRNFECQIDLVVQTTNISEVNLFLQTLEQSIMIIDKKIWTI